MLLKFDVLGNFVNIWIISVPGFQGFLKSIKPSLTSSSVPLHLLLVSKSMQVHADSAHRAATPTPNYGLCRLAKLQHLLGASAGSMNNSNSYRFLKSSSCGSAASENLEILNICAQVIKNSSIVRDRNRFNLLSSWQNPAQFSYFRTLN
jgi:hypothetical protein